MPQDRTGNGFIEFFCCTENQLKPETGIEMGNQARRVHLDTPPNNRTRWLGAPVSDAAVSLTSKPAEHWLPRVCGFGNPRHGRLGSLWYGGRAKMRPAPAPDQIES
jgi:hypothetical protein